MSVTHWCITGLLFVAMMTTAHGKSLDWVSVPSADFESVLAKSEGNNVIELDAFEIAATPVTNRQFLEFLKVRPEWRRDRVATIFADGRYLSHWQAPLDPGTDRLDWPVTPVSPTFTGSTTCMHSCGSGWMTSVR